MKIIQLNVYFGTNCYLVCDEQEKRCAVVDPGGDAEKIIEAVDDCACTPTAILLTHGHFDHVGAVKAMRLKWPELPVYLNERDVYPDADMKTKRLYPEIGETLSYDEGDSVSIGSLEVRVLATPGHTRGGVSLLVGDALLCGDTLFASSMGRTDLTGGSDEDMMRSLSKLGGLDGALKVLPGHMGASTIEQEWQRNPYLRQAMA